MMKKLNNFKKNGDLKKSLKVVGQIYPVLRDSKGKVIDGFHRLGVDPDWKSITLENVETEEDRLIVSAHANLTRRHISNKERISIINNLAEIYYKKGLKPDHREKRLIKSGGRWGNPYEQNIIVNQILDKLCEVLYGCMNRNQIRPYLYDKYLYKEHGEAMKEITKERHRNTPALELIMSSHGKQLIKAYGESIFGRLEKEMIDKAKKELKNNDWFINKIKSEIRKDVECEFREEIRLELKDHIKKEILKELNEELKLLLGSKINFFVTENLISDILRNINYKRYIE